MLLLLFTKGKIAATGYNTPISSKKEKSSYHAECKAIMSCTHKSILKNSIMVVIRLPCSKNPTHFIPSEPCDSCKRLIHIYQIPFIFYS